MKKVCFGENIPVITIYFHKVASLVPFWLMLCAVLVEMGYAYPADASPISQNDTIAVMDFGTRPGASEAEISVENAEHSSCDFVIQRFIDKKCFVVIDKDYMLNTLQLNDMNVCGIIDPDTAKKIGQMLNVRYIAYGNIANVSLSENGAHILGVGADVCTVKAHIVMRIMDVATGNIIMMAKGEGESQSSYVTIGVGNELSEEYSIKIGTVAVTQESVHNAIMKASWNAVDNIVHKVMKT